MHTLLALLLFVVVFVVPNQVIADDDSKDVEKRQVSVLARDGHLPYEGKRYVGDKKSDSKNSIDQWRNSNEDPSVLFMSKRYVGALAKTGDLRFRQREEKREDVDTLIDELLTAEELRKIRLQALREELLKQQEEEDDEDIEKRSLASLVRSGSLPISGDKRSIASMAKAGYLRSPNNHMSDDYDKRGISSLARNGQLPAFGKRGGISSIMRNGYSYQKRNFDSDLDSLLLDEYDVDDKRNVASLARSYNLPAMGKRNIASFARNGWIQDFGSNPKRALYEEWDDSFDESKRNLPSLLRNRVSPLVEGKRYLGAFVASNRLPYSKQNYDDSKRNMASMVRTWNTPESRYGSRYGKRDWYDDEIDSDDLAKRYVSSLLKQGPLPVSSENIETNSEDTQNYNAEQAKEDASENIGEEKRHVGSLLAHKSFAMRKKKSITLEDQFGDQAPTASSPLKARSDENKMNNELQQNQRQKREAFADFAPVSDEYPMPVLQNTEVSEYDDGNLRANSEEQNTRKKRYFAVRGGGKIPGGRLPHVGRSRSNNPNSGRRRH
ncbi:neuropeptide-like 1 isoform X2 [Macrosteles quadrilineatus]|uniref:neuropeptide-like 1 isoform X2 n=1 Tax=Macrosteles quadrilineatus TaxID=74068 RepID=UPI0023E11EE4|nr:neuropeptide-like 1 isoform X2 [Macrosteles quadrilineatus]